MKRDKRTYVNSEITEKVIEFLDREANNKKKERQVIYNYHTESDFKVIRTKNYVKLDLKENATDKENKVYVNKTYEKDMLQILTQIGVYVAVKRYRIRHMYQYKHFYITVDENIKYGNVLRIRYEENSDEQNEEILNEIKQIYEYFGIEESNMDTFQELYSKYRTSWADLTKDIDEEEFLNEN